MKLEIEKLESMNKELQKFMDKVYLHHKSITREVVFAGMIIKKTMDILSTASYTLKNNIISVQISLLRLLCDNCLAIQSAIELGLKEVIDLITNNQKVSNIMVDEEQNMSDGYLKRLVSKSYPGFDRLYNFACEGVHFSKQALGSAFSEENGKISMNIKVGNKELKNDIIYNNSQMITLCKVIMAMLKRVCIDK